MKDWSAALRSGAYKPGDLVLVKDNKYCCLGVLGAIKNYDISGEQYLAEFELGSMYAEWGQSYFSKLNDTLEWSFDQIANFIDALDDVFGLKGLYNA